MMQCHNVCLQNLRGKYLYIDSMVREEIYNYNLLNSGLINIKKNWRLNILGKHPDHYVRSLYLNNMGICFTVVGQNNFLCKTMTL